MKPSEKLIAVNRILKSRFPNLTTDDSIILSDKIVQAMEDENLVDLHYEGVRVSGSLESIKTLQKMIWELHDFKSKAEAKS